MIDQQKNIGGGLVIFLNRTDVLKLTTLSSVQSSYRKHITAILITTGLFLLGRVQHIAEGGEGVNYKLS